MAIEYYTGDTETFTLTLLEADGTAFVVDSGWTVKAAFQWRDTLLAGPWTASFGATGSDWANGVVVFEVVGADTSSLDTRTGVQIEAEVTRTGSKKKTFVANERVTIRKGVITT